MLFWKVTSESRLQKLYVEAQAYETSSSIL